jgi:cytochrome c553
MSQKNRNRLDKLCRSCHGNKQGGISKNLGFLSSNFMKLCRNIHRSVWQLLGGVEKIQNGGRCHGNQGAKNVKFTPNLTNFCSNVSCHIHI